MNLISMQMRFLLESYILKQVKENSNLYLNTWQTKFYLLNKNRNLSVLSVQLYHDAKKNK